MKLPQCWQCCWSRRRYSKVSEELELPEDEKVAPSDDATWVVDIGSYGVRSGISVDEDPRSQRCLCGTAKPTLEPAAKRRLLDERSKDGSLVVGDACLGAESLLDIVEPVARTVDWDMLCPLLPQGVAHLMIAAPLGAARPRDLGFKNFSAACVEHAFETLDVSGGVAVVSAAPLPLFAVGATDGNLVYAGHRQTLVTAVHAGYCEPYRTFDTGLVLPDGEVLDRFFPRDGPVAALADLEEPSDTIYVAGGNTFVPGYRARLEADLRHAVSTSSDRPLHFDFAHDASSAWRGAAILADSPQFQSWLAKPDYLEHGAYRAMALFTL